MSPTKPIWDMTEEEIKAYWNVTWKHPQPRWQDQQIAPNVTRCPQDHDQPRAMQANYGAISRPAA